MNFFKHPTSFIAFFFLAQAAVGDTVTLSLGDSITIGGRTVVCGGAQGSIQPAESSLCVKYNSYGQCIVSDTTYSLPGISCTANCATFGSYDQCVTRNTCEFIAEGTYFIKNECVKFNSYQQCTAWDKIYSKRGDQPGEFVPDTELVIS